MIRITEKSLVEQMGLNDREIARRLHLIDFTDTDLAHIKAAEPAVLAALDTIIRDFYQVQLENSDIAAVIGDIDTLKRLHGHMRGYVTLLFNANYNQEYANNRLRIGKVHKRLSVTPKLYMTAMSNLQSLLNKVIADAMEQAAAVQEALHKIMLFDTQLVFEAYIDGFLVEMETAREEVERYASGLGVKVESLTRHMHEIATKDALTGIYNRRAFYEYLARECGVAERHNLPLSLLYMDLNGFKPVNDTHGHDAGDQVLRQVGESLTAVTRSVDIAARYGGDEFCVVLPRTALDGAKLMVERLQADFAARCPYPVTFSIGVVQAAPGEDCDPSEMVKNADVKMYVAKARSKAEGGHQVEY